MGGGVDGWMDRWMEELTNGQILERGEWWIGGTAQVFTSFGLMCRNNGIPMQFIKENSILNTQHESHSIEPANLTQAPSKSPGDLSNAWVI